MISLKQHINSTDFSDFQTVYNLLENAKVKTSFWGSRLIEISGYTGSVKIDDIVREFVKIVCLPDDAPKNGYLGLGNSIIFMNLSAKERVGGLSVLDKMNKFYELSDEQISKSNLITKFSVGFFKVFRTLINYILPIRSIKDECKSINPNSFFYYTKESFKREFNLEAKDGNKLHHFITSEVNRNGTECFLVDSDQVYSPAMSDWMNEKKV
jgi:hypothetical protein